MDDHSFYDQIHTTKACLTIYCYQDINFAKQCLHTWSRWRSVQLKLQGWLQWVSHNSKIALQVSQNIWCIDNSFCYITCLNLMCYFSKITTLGAKVWSVNHPSKYENWVDLISRIRYERNFTELYLPLYMKTIRCKSKASAVCSVTTAQCMNLTWRN